MSLFPFIDGIAEDSAVKSTKLPMYTELGWNFEKNEFVVINGEFLVLKGNEALKVWIYKALKTPRYSNVIYSWNYGSELDGLIGKGMTNALLKSEVSRYISEALLINPYIKEIKDIVLNKNRDILEVSFKVVTVYGEVDINV